MKTKKHKGGIIAKAAILLALFLTFTPAATAQEYIKEVVNVVSDTNIVREYKEDVRIIYSHREDTNQFLMVSETGVTTTLLVIRDDIIVTDFEIMGDTLYFCGDRYLEGFYGALGYVDLANYPYVLQGYYFTNVGGFMKLEAFKSRNGGERHLAVTGDVNNLGSCVVDVKIAASGVWSFYYGLADSIGAIFDDVAVTDTRVVASLRTNRKNGYVYYYNHPASGNSFLINPVIKNNIGNQVLSPIILENCESGYFVSACRRDGGGQQGLNYYIDLKAFNDLTIYDNVAIHAPGNNERPLDLKYNHDSRELDLLESSMGQTSSYCIHHINSYGNINTRRFNQHRLYSIDYLTTNPNHFIVSGRGNEDQLRFIKYDPFYMGRCSDKNYVEYQKKEEYIILKSFPAKCHPFENYGIPTAKTNEEKTIVTRCYSDLKEDDSF